jgi:single-strand DNA-binding protein
MASLNQCNFIGNVGRDPEIRFTQDGKAIANFSIAVTEKWSGNEKTEWVRCVAFGKTAEVISDYVKKGTPLFITGRMQNRQWEKDGVTRYTTEIVVNQIQMLGKTSDTQPSGHRGGCGGAVAGGVPDDDDSSIPF